MKIVRCCENCGNVVECKEDWHNNSVLLEQHYECQHCKFKRHYAYGNLMPEDSEYKDSEVSMT